VVADLLTIKSSATLPYEPGDEAGTVKIARN